MCVSVPCSINVNTTFKEREDEKRREEEERRGERSRGKERRVFSVWSWINTAWFIKHVAFQ